MTKLKQLKTGLQSLDMRVGSVDSGASYDDPRRLSRHHRGYGTQWDKLRKQILQRDQHQCQTCLKGEPRRVVPAEHVDHVVPKEEGGSDAPANLQALCAPCHFRKTHAEKMARRGQAVTPRPMERTPQ